MIAQNIAFGVIAATMVGAAIRLVTTQNVVRAALFLVLVLAGAAAQFLLLSADFVAIVQAQAHGSIFGFGRLGEPFVITQFFGFLLFLAAAQAELIQTPFDMPLAESELVAGYLTEYSGLRYLLFYMAETASAFAFAAIAATLFLGGWYLPGIGPSRQLADVIGPFVLGAKIMLVAFLIYWIRFTYPRLREDQLQTFAWKYLIPLSLVNILVTGILKVVF